MLDFHDRRDFRKNEPGIDECFQLVPSKFGRVMNQEFFSSWRPRTKGNVELVKRCPICRKTGHVFNTESLVKSFCKPWRSWGRWLKSRLVTFCRVNDVARWWNYCDDLWRWRSLCLGKSNDSSSFQARREWMKQQILEEMLVLEKERKVGQTHPYLAISSGRTMDLSRPAPVLELELQPQRSLSTIWDSEKHRLLAQTLLKYLMRDVCELE